MVSKKTFINTILILCLLFIGILAAFYFYYENKIDKIEASKENITIIQNSEITGLENIIVE